MNDLPAETTVEALALQSIASAAVPDVTDTSYHAQIAQIGMHAQSAYNALLAQYRFLGLLSGIKGPNDTDRDVEEARGAVMEALADVLKAGPLSQARDEAATKAFGMRDRLQERIYDGYRNGANSDELLAADTLLGELVRGHPGNESESRLENIASGAYRQRYIDRLVFVPRDMQDGFYDLIRQQEVVAGLEDASREAQRSAIANFFRGIWEGVRDYYNENMELIRNGQWLLAVGRITVDAAIFAAEEIVVAGIVTAIIALTAGMAAGMVLVLRSAVRMMLSVVAQGARVVRNVRANYVFRIELRHVEPGVLYSNPIPFNVTVSRKLPYSKDIDVQTDLTPDERRAMGEGGQGSTLPDADAPESGPDAGTDADGSGGSRSNRPRADRKEIECFNVPKGVDRAEFDRQLKEQQDTINKMTADDLGYAHAVLDQARMTWREQGSKGSFTRLIRGNGKAQDAARLEYASDLEAAGLSKAAISEIMSGLDATHYLDIIAGGDPNDVGMGGSAENQRIGPAWTYTNTPSGISRADTLRREADALRAAGKSDHLMNVGLKSCN